MKELNAYVNNLNIWIKHNKCSIKTPYTLASKHEADERFYRLNVIAHQLVKLDPTLTIHEME
jgi:hypothetical protein